MKTYTGTKTVNATPMTRQAYNDFRGWTLPADENGADDGYLVEYTDGGKPNTTQYAGYVSWSPKEQFDLAYHEVAANTRPPHQQRVIDEKAELSEKLNKLNAFLGSEIFAGLDVCERTLLYTQGMAMAQYAFILGQRIDRFPA